MKKPAYLLLYKESVAKDLWEIHPAYRGKIVRKIKTLKNNPYPAGLVKLQGALNLYRIRSGDFRIIYQIQNSQLVVLVVKIGHRKDIYSKF